MNMRQCCIPNYESGSLESEKKRKKKIKTKEINKGGNK